ncbi:MAG: hypothetical protein GXP31_04440 [Kiritimatiellaeota bacterium]|nr:hypothetical protein [Kiritimatiellota bacterium]
MTKTVGVRHGAIAAMLLSVAAPLSQAEAAGVPANEPLEWSVPRLPAPPKIDGIVGEQEWSAAAGITGFSGIGRRAAARYQPVGFLGFDRNAIYLALTIPRPTDAPLVCNATDRDGPVWDDDSVEFFLAVGAAPYRHFIVSARNVRYDEIGKRGSVWNGVWRSATRARPRQWSVEISVPWSNLGVKAPPKSLRANLCWNRRSGGTSETTWAPVMSSYHEPDHFATLILVKTGPAVRFTGLSFTDIGVPRWTFCVTSGRAVLRTQVFSTGDKAMLSTEHHIDTAGASFSPDAQRPPLAPGLYRITYRCDGLARGAFGFEVLPPFDWKITQRMLAGVVDVSVDLSRLKRPAAPVSVRLHVLSDVAGKLVRSIRLPVTSTKKVRCTIRANDLPVGRYRIEADVLDAGGKTISRRTDGTFRKPRTPEWRHFTGGMTHKVLPPWTPITLDKRLNVHVQGRVYAMPNGLLPNSIRIRGREFLAGPIAVAATVNGKTSTWKASAGNVQEARGEMVALTGDMVSAGVRVTGTAVIEYDGMIKVELNVVPLVRNPTVSLVLEVPLQPDAVEYLYTFPGVWGSTRNAGALPPDGWRSAFRPYVWLGDNDAGVAWFCESAQGWRPRDPEQALTVTRAHKKVVLRLHLFENAVLRHTRRYVFGFQATPVKAPEHDAWDYRILRIGSYGLDKKRANRWNTQRVLWPGRGKIDLRKGSLELWVRPDFDPSATGKDAGLPKGLTLFYAYTEGPGIRRQCIDFFWDRVEQRFRVYAAVGRKPTVVREKLASFPCTHWKKGEWRRIGLTWGPEFTLWVDGRRADSRKFSGFFPTPPESPDAALENTRLCLISNPVAVDELSISSRVQDLSRGPDKPSVSGSDILFVEHFDADLRATSKATMNAQCRPTPGKFCKGVLLYIPEDSTYIENLAALGCRTIVFHQSWSNIQNSGIPADPRALRDLVQACHKNGMQLLLYFGFEMSDANPDWDIYHAECLQVCSDPHAVPSRQQVYNRPNPPQHAYHVCYRSPWRNYLAWSVAKLMDDYGIDGVYLDGTEYLFPCSNEYHGCGYAGAGGKRHDAYPIFAVRDLMKRLYTIVKTRKPNGQINAHSSTCMIAPTIAWATSLWDGEQIANQDLRRVYFGDIIPLDTFRAEFMGRSQGVPTEFLAYGVPNQHRALAFTLIHDVIVRLDNDPVLAGQLWRAMDDFGRRHAAWLPYWSNGDCVRVTPRDVKVSLYNRAKKGVLLVVSNLGKSKVDAMLVLDTARLGLGSGTYRASDALTHESLTTSGGTLHLPLRSMEWRLIEFTPTAP